MKIGFIGVGNAVRSLMAEAVARKLFREALLNADVYSAGVEPDKEVKPEVLEILQRKGYPTEGLKPKSIEDIPFEKLDLVVVVCNEAKEKVPFVLSHKRRENWGIELPSTLNAGTLSKVLEGVENNVRALLKLV